MNRLILFLIWCFTVIAATAQTADIEVGYVAHSPNLKDGETDITSQYILLANTLESKFFSPMTEYIDSLNSTPDGKTKYQEMTRNAYLGGKFDDIPRKDGSYYVVKSFTDNTVKYFDNAGLNKYYYDEPMEEWNWTINDSTKNILGYECIEASTNYHGRKWNAWFSPEIPIQNGPWKLDGLPGLILEASTEGGQYSFIAIGIQHTTKPILPVYLANEHEKTTRKNFWKSKRAFLDNPLGNLNAQLGGEIEIVKISKSDNENQNDLIFAPASVVDFIETDYR